MGGRTATSGAFQPRDGRRTGAAPGTALPGSRGHLLVRHSRRLVRRSQQWPVAGRPLTTLLAALLAVAAFATSVAVALAAWLAVAG
jgi:hypothetical protein